MTTNRGYALVVMTVGFFDVLGIAVMIYLLGGFVSAYVQGLYIIMMGSIVALPLSFRDSAIVFVLIWASYVIPSALNLPSGKTGWRDIVTNLFFLLRCLRTKRREWLKKAWSFRLMITV